MKSEWIFDTTHDGICFINNSTLGIKNYYRMKNFMKKHFKNRYEDNVRNENSLFYGIIKVIVGEEYKKEDEVFVCYVLINHHKIKIAWSHEQGIIVKAKKQDGNQVIRELYSVLCEIKSDTIFN